MATKFLNIERKAAGLSLIVRRQIQEAEVRVELLRRRRRLNGAVLPERGVRILDPHARDGWHVVTTGEDAHVAEERVAPKLPFARPLPIEHERASPARTRSGG